MLQHVLNELEQAIYNQAELSEPLIRADRWILTSMIHKSIRRGDSDNAARAAFTLLKTDPRSFWARLHIIALEDINVGSVDTIIKVLAASSAPAWRKKVGDVQVGVYLTRLLCQGVKTRLSDFIFIQAERGKNYDTVRHKLAVASDEVLVDYIADTRRDIVERAIAIWLLAGTQKYNSDKMPHRLGSVDKATQVVRALNAPPLLTEACVAVIKLSRYPLSLFTPLIWQEVQKHGSRIQFNPIAPAIITNGIPDCALDQFTRLGLACIRELQRTVPCLREFSAKQLGLAVFYEEGGLINSELTSPELDAIKFAGQATDLEGVGLDTARYEVLRSCLIDNFGELAAIRKEHLQQYTRSAA